MALTDTAVRQAKPLAKAYKLADSGGLFLYVTPAGSRLWRWKYRVAGRERSMSFGAYPDVSLARARELHRRGREVLAAGTDPMAERRAGPHGPTFKTVAKAWYKQWAPGKTPKYAEAVWRRLEADILPALEDVPVAELTAAQVRVSIKSIEKRGAIEVAKRQLQKCGQIMRYAVANGLAERNPVADIQPSDILPARKKRHYNRISARDLPRLLHDMDDYTGGEHTRLALQFMALTFVRTSELIGARWEEFDMKARRWNIPAERMKMRIQHIVPLSRQAMAVLAKLKAISYGREFVFPSDTGKPTHMSNNTMLYALYRMGYRGRMTGHGYRGIASTILHELEWPHDHIERQLAHLDKDDTASAYNFALYLRSRTKMMQAWADHLDTARAAITPREDCA